MKLSKLFLGITTDCRFLSQLTPLAHVVYSRVLIFTSNGGCRREEKSRKHWSLFTKLLSSITAIVFIC